MNGIIRVLLVGGNEVMREELSRILGSEEEIIVVGEARGGEEALAEARKLSPDVVIALTDDRMLGTNISDTARAITEAQLPFKVIIIAENPVRYLVPTIKAGVAGLLPRILVVMTWCPLYVKYTCGTLAPSLPVIIRLDQGTTLFEI